MPAPLLRCSFRSKLGWWPFLWGFWKPLSVLFVHQLRALWRRFCWGKCSKPLLWMCGRISSGKRRLSNQRSSNLASLISQWARTLRNSSVSSIVRFPPCQHMPGFQSYLCSGLSALTTHPSMSSWAQLEWWIPNCLWHLGNVTVRSVHLQSRISQMSPNRRRVWIPTTKRLLSDLWISSQHYINHNLVGLLWSIIQRTCKWRCLYPHNNPNDHHHIQFVW